MSAHPPDRSAPRASGRSQEREPSGDRDRAGTLAGARPLLRIDGIFEAALGALLAVTPATGLYAALDLPSPATRAVIVICGLLLLPLLPILWRASRVPRRRFVLMVAIANGTGAVVLTLWALVWRGSFHPAGLVFVLGVAGILALLAALQARSALAA